MDKESEDEVLGQFIHASEKVRDSVSKMSDDDIDVLLEIILEAFSEACVEAMEEKLNEVDDLGINEGV